MEVNAMTTDHATLGHVSDLVRTEITGYLSDAFVIAEVTSEILPGPDGDDYIRTVVIFEDDHPELDARALNQFSTHIDPLCKARGFDRPTIAYANRSEIPV
jgi:hypothetical protein